MSRTAYDVAEQVREQLQQTSDVRLSHQQIRLLEQVNSSLEAVQLGTLRIVSYGDERPPKANLKIINNAVIERWEPHMHIYTKGESISGIPRISYYTVTQYRLHIDDTFCNCVGTLKLNEHSVHNDCGRKRVNTRAYWDFDNNKPQTFGEHVRNIHVNAMSDFAYDGLYPSIPGDAVIHYDPAAMANVTYKSKDQDKMQVWRGSKVLRSRPDNPKLKRMAVKRPDGKIVPTYKGPSQVMRGGHEITGGRREWRDKTKDMVLYDKGVEKDWERVRKDKQAARDKKIAEFERKVEAQIREIAPDD